MGNRTPLGKKIPDKLPPPVGQGRQQYSAEWLTDPFQAAMWRSREPSGARNRIDITNLIAEEASNPSEKKNLFRNRHPFYLPRRRTPLELIARHRLQDRVFERGGEREVRFLFSHQPAILPVWLDGWLQLVRWGTRRGESGRLPVAGWTWQATVEAGDMEEVARRARGHPREGGTRARRLIRCAGKVAQHPGPR
jgi:hypothetical protein